MPGSFKTSAPSSPFRVLVRFAAVAVAVLWLARGYSTDVVEALLPAVQAEMAALDRDFAILSLDIHQDGPTRTIRLRADVAHTIFVRGRPIHPLGDRPGAQGWYQVNITARGVLASTLLCLIAVLGWPAKSPRETLLRILLALPLVTLLIVVDVPLELLGNLHEVVARQVDPEGFRLLFAGDKWLDGGGDFAAALAAATVVITFSAKGLSWRKRVQRASPRAVDLRKTAQSACGPPGFVTAVDSSTLSRHEQPPRKSEPVASCGWHWQARLAVENASVLRVELLTSYLVVPSELHGWGAIRLGTAIRSNNPAESHRQSPESRT